MAVYAPSESARSRFTDSVAAYAEGYPHLGGYRWGLERKRRLLELEATYR